MDGGAWWAAVHGVARSRTRLSNFTFPFHFHALEKEMATHSSVLAWRIPGTGEPGGLPSMGSHRIGHDWSDLTVTVQVAHCYSTHWLLLGRSKPQGHNWLCEPQLGSHRLCWDWRWVGVNSIIRRKKRGEWILGNNGQSLTQCGFSFIELEAKSRALEWNRHLTILCLSLDVCVFVNILFYFSEPPFP